MEDVLLRVTSKPNHRNPIEFTYDIGKYASVQHLTMRVGDFCNLGRRQIFIFSEDMGTYSVVLDCDGTQLRRLYENGVGRAEVDIKRQPNGQWLLVEYWSPNQLHPDERKSAHQLPSGAWERILWFQKDKFVLKD